MLHSHEVRVNSYKLVLVEELILSVAICVRAGPIRPSFWRAPSEGENLYV